MSFNTFVATNLVAAESYTSTEPFANPPCDVSVKSTSDIPPIVPPPPPVATRVTLGTDWSPILVFPFKVLLPQVRLLNLLRLWI